MTFENVLVGLLAVSLCCISLYLAGRPRRIRRLRKHGIRADAEVVWIRTESDGDGNPKYVPLVSFSLPDGTEVKAASATGSMLKCSLQEGDRTKVTHDPAGQR